MAQSLALLIAVSLCIAVTKSFAGPTSIEPDTWHFPVSEPKLSAPFGQVSALRAFKAHKGIDLLGHEGTPVFAAASGQVDVADDTSVANGFGLVVVLQHGGEWQSLYAHLSEVRVQPGEQVKQGQLVGLMGHTGKVTGPHLHFEITHKDKHIDPLDVIKEERQ